MLQHYILTAWRNIMRNRLYSAVLIAGLATGIAASLLLGLYSWNELSYDSFHINRNRIFLVAVDAKEAKDEYVTGWTTPPTGPAMQEDFPEVQTTTRLCNWFDDVVVSRGSTAFPEQNILGADSTVFSIFTIPFLAGNPATALKNPNSVVLTRAMAEKYFGNDDPMGKNIHFDHFLGDCLVTGVVEDYPPTSHFGFGFLVSLSTLKAISFDFENSWSNHTFSTYVLLRQGADAAQLEKKLPKFIQSRLEPYLIQRYDKSYKQMYKDGDYYRLKLVPLTQLHLSTLIYENREGQKTLIYGLGILAVTIILLVAINYMNLSTVLAMGRAKEAGIRKVTGSSGVTLFWLFISESVLLSFAGLLLALGVAEVCLPLFNELTGGALHLPYSNPTLIGGMIVFTLLTGVISGFYPAVTFASGRPVVALRGARTSPGGSPLLRNALVTFQFTICIATLICTMTVYKQFAFMTEKNTGFNKEQVLVIKRAGGLKDNKKSFKTALLKEPGVLSVSYTQTTPGRHFDGHGQHFAGTPPNEVPTIYPLVADEDILETLDVPLVSGKTFKETGVNQVQAILNESAVTALGLRDPLEAVIDLGTMGAAEVNVIGVARDFHFKSFRHSVEPLIIYSVDPAADPRHMISYALVKLSGQNIPETVSSIQQQWKNFAGSYPFEYTFLDEDFRKLFEREQRMARVNTAFSVIAILISVLGLLGLTAYFAERRTKEIGIRKISGASFADIVLLLSGNFLMLLAVSFVAGSMLAMFLLNHWLQGFAYRTPLSWWIFAVSGVILLLAGILTTSWKVYAAASKNPVDTLRYE